MQRLYELSGRSFSVPPEEGSEHIKSHWCSGCSARRGLILVAMIPSSFVLQSPWVIFVLFPVTTCTYAFSFHSLPVINFLLVVFVVSDLQGCAPVVTTSFPLWFVFSVGDLWYLPVLVLFHNTFYSRIYATEHSYWLLLLTISVNHTITQN